MTPRYPDPRKRCTNRPLAVSITGRSGIRSTSGPQVDPGAERGELISFYTRVRGREGKRAHPLQSRSGLGLPRSKRRDYVYLTHGQVLVLGNEAGRGRLLMLLLGYTGLRWAEATALRVCDIDLDRRRVDVRRAFSDVGGRVVLGTPKSHQSRTVPCPGSSRSTWPPPSTARAPTSSCSPCPAAQSCACPTGGTPPSSRPALVPGSAAGSASTIMPTCGTPPPR